MAHMKSDFVLRFYCEFCPKTLTVVISVCLYREKSAFVGTWIWRRTAEISEYRQTDLYREVFHQLTTLWFRPAILLVY